MMILHHDRCCHFPLTTPSWCQIYKTCFIYRAKMVIRVSCSRVAFQNVNHNLVKILLLWLNIIMTSQVTNFHKSRHWAVVTWLCKIATWSDHYCPACRTTLIATRFWVVMICPIIKCLTVLEVSFILFDLCLFITIFNFILNHEPIVTFWIFTYHKILILLIIFCFIWSYWILYFLTCLEVFWSVVS